jgi:hypothetical protein
LRLPRHIFVGDDDSFSGEAAVAADSGQGEQGLLFTRVRV